MLRNYLAKLDKKLLLRIRQIGQESDSLGFNAYVVGGVVRDILLKKKNLDLDVVVEGDARLLAKVLARKMGGRLIIHDAFKTASIEVEKKFYIDFSSSRKERYAHPGALPMVSSSHLKDDLFRRDFTINAMAIRINQKQFGELVDLFGSVEDLRKKRVRVLHDLSFVDDPTRILRAVRFEQRLGFKIEPHTLKLLRFALQSALVNHVKSQRYFAEFKKTLKESNPVKSLQRLYSLGGLKFIDSNLRIDSKVLKKIYQISSSLGQKEYQWWLVYLIALLDKLNQKVIAEIPSKYHLKREEAKAIEETQRAKKTLINLKQKLSRSEIFRLLKPFEIEVILYLRVKANRLQLVALIDRFLKRDRFVSLLINGDDLKNMGVKAGPEIGRILDKILDQKIDKQFKKKQEELNCAKQLIHKLL